MSLRYGIVGCGKIYSTHCDALLEIEGARLAAVYDTDSAAACAASERYGVPAAKTLDELFGEIDAAIVCVPSGLHAEVGIAAAKAGKHVVVEKPIDVTLDAATRLVRSCREAGVKFTCISQHRFARDIRRLRDAALGGDLGRVLQGDAYVKWYRTQAYYDSGDWRGTYALDGGGCLMNQGVHYVDMLQWVMGGIKSVQAVCRTMAHSIEVEDVAYALVEYHSGAIGLIHASTNCYPGLAERLEVHGVHGSVILEGDRVKLWQVDPVAAQQGQYGGGVMMQPTPNLHLTGVEATSEEEARPSHQWGEQHRLQLEDFTQAVADDRDPYITGEMALEPLKVILSIYESSRRGGEKVVL
ncbi:Gfo/Idh/MocA family protein [Fimbriimonas ginsengisoli]|uniref:Oxidoreductase domain protein n=1 Tax=Fimbriimonas ginsengisoli Gsoil 348 TaxID=661478 RepID=A0A068NYR8_FIMGI|nr:Gfo/Idh/MocA family oxidoreductase [Fimbriimonas ginsengisoli]AIE87299.1 oxidoreductase domain protein [Fimbriimonas ginsengisoli Gsoil 348]